MKLIMSEKVETKNVPTTNSITQSGIQNPGYSRRWIAVVALGLSLFLSALDATIVSLALPAIANHFSLSDSLVASVTLAYAIPLTLLVLPAGSILNRFRSLPIFLVSIAGFGVGSVICGFAPNLLVLLIGRVVQGSFAALIGTQGFALAAAIVSPKERGKAMGIIGTIAPLGGVTGPGIGGLLLASFGWSTIFFVNLPVIVAASLLGVFSLKGVSLAKQGPSVNIYAQIARLLRRSQFSFGILAFFLSVSMTVALYYILPFDLLGVQQLAPEVSGVILLSVPLGMMAMGIFGGYLTDRYQPRPFVLIGSGLLLAGVALLSFITTSRTSELDMVWRLELIGAGMGLFSSPNQTSIMSVGGRETMGAASALSNLSARLGTVFGPLAVGITWSLVSGFPQQIASGTLIMIVLSIVTFLFAVFSSLTMKPVQKH
jgi:DHA2 family multidrug resistance protein-like MFS transporter